MSWDVTVCTTFYDDGKEPVLVASCRKWDIPLRKFGTANRFEGFLKTKVIPLRDFVAKVKTQYVMFLDGNDTFFVSPLEKVMQTYQELVGDHHKYLIGSEFGNWPYDQYHDDLVRKAKATGTKSPFHFTDPGLLVGETEAVHKALVQIVDSVPGYAKRMPDVPRKIMEDDVGLWVLNMIDEKVDPWIDYDCRMIIPLKGLEWNDYSFHKGRLHCHLTNTWPHIIHCNGHRSLDRKTFRRAYRALVEDGDEKVYKLMRVPSRGKTKWGV